MSEYNILINKYDALNAGYDQLYPKPMKHANTHASDGTDPITPGDIGAYSKTETDTLLQNKMADDHGYIDNCDDMTFNGPYRGYSATINGPSLIPDWNYGAGFAIRRETGVYQFWMFNRYFAARKGEKVDGVWTYKPWEYFNPPMILGVEYRTTERYRGKPVYQKLIDFGALPNNTQKDVSIFASGETNTMECGIDVKLISHSNQAYKTLTTLTTQVLQNGGVTVKTNYNSSATSVYALCYYTKTTD